MPRLTEAQLTFGTELDPHGRRIGRDPRGMTSDELRAIGHEPKPVLAAMRAHCIDCCGGSRSEVSMCVSVSCPQWAFRMGDQSVSAPGQRGAARAGPEARR